MNKIASIKGWATAMAAGVNKPRYVVEDENSSPPEVFADSERLLPIGTKADTWRSAVKLAGAGVIEGPEFDKVMKAASWHGIEKDVEEVYSKVLPKAPGFAKASLADEIERLSKECAFVYVGKDGKPKGVYPIKTAADLEYSSVCLYEDICDKRLTPEMALKAARKIVKRASQINEPVKLHRKIAELGADNTPDFDFAKNAVGRLMGSQEAEELALQIIEQAEESYAKQASLDEFASMLSRLQEVANPSASYPAGRLLFSGISNMQAAKAAAERVFINGVAVPRNEFIAVRIPEGALSMQEMMKLAAAIDAAETGQTVPELPPSIAEITLRALIGKL